MSEKRNFAILTSGGDAPGMNAAIRSFVKASQYNNINTFGIKNGYQGLIEGKIISLNYSNVNNIIQLGGTILGTARSKDFLTKEGRDKAYSNLQKNQIDGLVVVGGDGSFNGASLLSKENKALNVICLPGTIDNDIFGTDFTIGYDTALNTVINAVDKIRDTANSHNRIFFVEVMGRDSGFLALNSAIASGAESVLIPEEITDLKALAHQITTQNKGERSSIIIVAEGDDAGGSAEIIKKVQPYLPDYNLRSTVLGHIQRGGSPTFFDRYLGTLLGAESVSLLLDNQSEYFLGYQNGKIVKRSLHEVIGQKHQIKEKNQALLATMCTIK